MLSTESQNSLMKLLNKESYVPPAQGGPPGGAPMPMDPAAAMAGGGGQPPMPMPPPEGGGQPPMPMDPSMMGGDPNAMPMDPTMGGQEDMPVPVVLDINDLKAILEEASQGGSKMDRMEKIVESMAKRMGIEIEQEEGKEQSQSEGLPAYLQVPGIEEGLEESEQSAILPEAQSQGQSQAQPQGGEAQEDLQGVINMLQGG